MIGLSRNHILFRKRIIKCHYFFILAVRTHFMILRPAFIFLVLLLLLQAGGLLLICNIHQSYVQHEMTIKLNDSKTTFEKITITLKENETFKDPGNEFSMDGKMYDVKYISFEGNKVHLLVIHDTEEESVLSIIKNLINNTNSSKNPFSSQLNLLLSMVYYQELTDFVFSPSEKILPDFLLYTESSFSADAEILSPPPKVV